MRLLVTCGPTYEPLDQVRRLTNFSTGKLGAELANHLAAKGHEVTLLQGYYSTYRNVSKAVTLVDFTTTANLLLRLRELSPNPFDALFHAAAVSDFQFGQVFARSDDGALQPLQSGKFSTRQGTLLAELLPTPKIISELQSLFPAAKIFGWKYEVDGTPQSAVDQAKKQIDENRTHFSIVNGPAYGPGFGLLPNGGQLEHFNSNEALYEKLGALIHP